MSNGKLPNHRPGYLLVAAVLVLALPLVTFLSTGSRTRAEDTVGTIAAAKSHEVEQMSADAERVADLFARIVARSSGR